MTFRGNELGFGKNRRLVNALLWSGAVLAIAGLWWPNWIGALAGNTSPFLNLLAFRTPLVSYLGYVTLWVACILVVGLKGSASDYRAPGWVGLASVVHCCDDRPAIGRGAVVHVQYGRVLYPQLVNNRNIGIAISLSLYDGAKK
jgi:hypothetical protein